MPFRRLEVERLEDRLAPATNITIIATGVGSLDHFLSATTGAITTANDPGDAAATLSKGALAGVNSTTNISIAADAKITFNDLGGTLSLQTGLGHSVTFSTTSDAISFNNTANTLATAGGSITISAGKGLTVANLNTGGGDVSLTAGTGGAGNLGAHGILTAGSGNITLQAINAAGGTITQTGAASGLAINATATGNVTVDSLRGTTVALTSNTNSVTSAGGNPVQASSELTVSAATGITLNTLAASLQASNSTSGNISVTQAASPAQSLTITGTGVVNQANGGTISITNNGGSITVSGGVNVQSSNGAIELAATDLQINGTVNSGTAVTTLANSTAGRQIDVGTNTAGKIGLTQAELNNVTAAVLRIGSNTAGSINVSAAITNPATWNTLTLIANGPITEAAAGSLTLPNLRVSGVGPVTLTSANNVNTLAANTTNAFSFSNGTHLLTVGTVDGDTGIVTSSSDVHLIADDMTIAQQVTTGSTTAGVVNLEPFTASETIDLGTNSAKHLGLTNTELNEVTAGVLRIGSSAFTGIITVSAAINPANIGALSLITGNTITQGAGDTITVAGGAGGLAVQATFGVELIEANDVGTLAAAITGSSNHFFYNDVNGFTVSTVDGLAGITAHGGGALVILSAGGSVTQDSGASIISHHLLLLGAGGYSLNDTGNDVDTLTANKVTNSVSYTNADDLTIGQGFISLPPIGIDSASGSVNVSTVAGDLTVSLIVSALAANQTVSLTAGGLDHLLTNNATISADTNVTLTADRMALGMTPTDTITTTTGGSNVVTLRGFTQGRTVDLGGTGDPTGTLQLSQAELNTISTDILRIGDLGTEGSITVTAALTDAATTWKTLSLLTGIGAGISQNSGATLTVTNLQAGGNTGVTLNQNNVVSTLAGATGSGAFSFVDSTSLTVDNVDNGLGFGFGIGIITDGQVVSLTVNVLNDSLTVNQHIDTTHNFGNSAPGGANINLSADNMALNNNGSSSTINAGTGGVLTLTPFTPTNTISVGGADAAGTLGIDDNDLTNVTAQAVVIGSLAQTGAVTVGGTINTHSGFNTLDLKASGFGGAITQTTGSIAVANLVLEADAGIGSAGAIQVVGPIIVSFANGESNNVQINSTGALTIGPASVGPGAGISTSFNNAGTTTLTASSPMTIASAGVQSKGTITATTIETASENVTPLFPPDDDLTVTNTATVESTGGDVVLTSGDSIVTQSGSTLKSDAGTVSLTAGMGDVDSDAALTLDGTISSSSDLTLSSPGDITLGQIAVSEATGTLSVTSTGGSIRDDGDASTFIEAHNINLTAAKAIGGDTQISRNDVLTQDAVFKQAIDFDLGAGGTLTLSQTGTGGNIQLRNIDGTTNTSVLGGVEPVGTGNQLALIASSGGFANDSGNTAGDLVVDTALTLPSANNVNLLLGSTSGATSDAVTVSNAITDNGTGGTVTLVASSPVNVNAAVIADGSINLISAGNAAGDGVFIAAGVIADGTGSITVDANRDVSITGTNTELFSNGAGGISVTAAEGLPNFPTSGTGAVFMGSSTGILDFNGTITVDAGTTAGTGGDITLAVLNANTGAVNVKSFNGSILDGNGSANNIRGGAINLSAGGAAGINLDVITGIPAIAGVTATSTNGNITLRSDQSLQVDSISATASHDVNLTVVNPIPTTSSITSLHPNDGVADVTGRTVTLTATGPTTGNTGQIGFFTSSAQFFEVAATTINANTNNSRVWISAINGAAVGSITAGADLAVLKTVNGDLTSTHTGANVTTPEVTAGSVILNSPATSGSFGAAAKPLQVQTSSLTANVSGAGSINVRNVAAGGNLSVPLAKTTNGDINLTVAGGNLTTTASTGNDINAPGHTVTLSASGAVISGTGAGVTDVASTNLAIDPTGVGTSANPLKTAVADLAANVGNGGVFVTNTSPALTIGSVGGINGVTATGGNITIRTSNDLTVFKAVSTPGAVTLTGDAANGPGNINISAPITGSSANVRGGTGSDVFTVTTLGATTLHVDGVAGSDLLKFDGQHLHALGTLHGVITIDESPFPVLTYANIQGLNLNNAAAVDAFYGPDTADRATFLAGLTTGERFVQVLYLDALGRAGSKGEIDAWAAIFGVPNITQTQAQIDIASGIEGSPEARGHMVRGWYVHYLGRAAGPGEELGWANLLLHGQTEEQVLSQILASTEFFNHAQTLGFGGSADSQYVQALYELALHRAGSSPEVAAWVGNEPALGRAGVALGFLDSMEFRTSQFEGYYNALLHRLDDPAGLNGWLSVGADVFTTRVLGFEAGPEFFNNG